MSTDSPAKKERIERHLMRQRGAGVRTVSATFGFAFGSSAPSSQEHTPVSIEPPAKRRKTILKNEIAASDDNVETAVRHEATGVTAQNKKRKVRKRWAPEDDDAESIVRSHTVDEDDSFIGGLKAAKTAAKKSAKTATATKREQDIDLAAESPTIKAKPRRRATAKAIAKAIAKVTDDLLEENGPIDAKRREPEINVRSKRPARTRRKQDGPTEVSSGPSKTNDLLDTDVSAKNPSTNARAKLAAQAEIEEPPLTLSNQDTDPVKESGQLEPKPRKAASRKRKQRDIVEEVGAAGKIELIPPEITENKASSRTQMVSQAAAKSTQESQRVPLKESDPNVTIVAASPAKPDSKPQRATSTRSKKAVTVEPTKPAQHDQVKPSKRRKVQVRQDEVDVDTAAKDSKARSHKIDTGTRQRQIPAVVPQDVAPKDEDIDWLFQDPSIKNPQPVCGKQPPPTKRGPRTPKKLADIDLDDLLSNIASFAQIEAQGPTGNGSETVKNHRPRAAGKTAKRRDRR